MRQTFRSYHRPAPQGWEHTCQTHNAWQEHHLNSEVTARRWPALLGWGTMILFGIWVVSASSYVLFHDEMLQEVVDERSRMQAAYEDRIMRLRSEVESINGRLLLNQDEFDRKLDILRTRQASLEGRQSTIQELLNYFDAGPISNVEHVLDRGNGPLRPASSGRDEKDRVSSAGRLQRNGREIRLTFAPRIQRATGARLATTLRDTELPPEPNNSLEHGLIRLARSQEKLEVEQLDSLVLLEERSGALARGLAGRIASLGVRPEPARLHTAKLELKPIAAGMGGPFVPVVLDTKNRSPFDLHTKRIRANISHTRRLLDQLNQFPIRSPLDGSHKRVSGYGVRLDPFLRVKAMHYGIDFRARRGTKARATAAGRVTMAGRNGGYGKVVEIQHANGLSTRYAHLSKILVRKGQEIEAGTAIGLVGSTGRSTGPHLHYEVRQDDDAVDPNKYMKLSDLAVQ